MNSPDILTLAKLYLIEAGDDEQSQQFSIEPAEQKHADSYLLIRVNNCAYPTFYLRPVVQDGAEEIVG